MITELDRNTALILIDLQKGVVKSEHAHPASIVIENAVKLLKAFREAGQPVVIVNVNPFGASWTTARIERDSIFRKSMAQSIMKAGAAVLGMTDIVPEIEKANGDIYITKKHWNAFFSTPLHDALQAKNVTGIVIGGISTSIGVEGTARAASELGYNLTFATDAMTDRIAAAHENSIAHIFPRMGELGTTDEIIAMLKKH